MVDEEHQRLAPGVAMLSRWMPRSAFESAFGVSIEDNFLLRLPDRQLPRLRVLMLLLRAAVAITIVMKVLTVMMPPAILWLLLFDVLIITPLCVSAMLFATWAHVGDMREKFHLEHLLLAPQGPAMLAQALFLRPLGAVGSLVVYYVLFSLVAMGVSFFLLGLVMGDVFRVFAVPLSLFLLICILLGPWTIFLGFISASTVDWGLRRASIKKMPLLTGELVALVYVILGVEFMALGIVMMTIVILPAIVLPELLLVWAFILFWASLYASHLIHKKWLRPTMQEQMRNLGEDLKGAWREE